MPNPAGASSIRIISRKNRALLAAALVALGAAKALPVLRAQGDLATIRTRAEQGDPEALNALANAHANGQGVPQNFAEAHRLYSQAAERGLAAAQFNLGMMHELGRGVAADMPTAFKHYLKAAEQGFAPAQFNVGNMYANGIGVKQDYFEAALWFRQAADRNVPEAQYNLALAYELGRGLVKDEAAAQRWYRQAASQRYARAQYNLALMLEEGRGSAPDPAAAIEFYRAAAQQNFAPAQNNLGILLAEGRGAPANPVEAYTWLALAVENGAKPVGRDIVAQQLTSAQLAEAKGGVAKMRAQLGLREPAPGVAAAPASGGAGTTAAAPRTSTPSATTPGSPPAEIVALNKRVVTAETELERLTAENARLNEAAQALTREKSTLQNRLAAATTAAEKAKADHPESKFLAQQLGAALAKENAQLKSAKQPTKAPPATRRAEEAALQARVEQLTAEANALRTENAEAKKRADELAAQLKTASETKTAAAATDATTSQQAGDARVAKLIADNARLNDEVKRSTIELTRLGRELRLAQEKGAQPGASGANAGGAAGAEIARQMEELRAANEQAKQALVAAQAEAARATTAGAKADSEQVADLKRMLTASQQSEAAQKNAVAQLRTQLATAERAAPAQPAANSREVEQLRAGLADAQAKLAAARRDQSSGPTAQRLLDVTEQLQVVSAERDRLLQAQATLVATRDSLAEATRQRDALASEKAATEQRMAKLATELAEQRTAAEKLEEANRNLGNRFDAAIAERDRLAAAARSAAGGGADVAKLNAQVETANRALADLTAKNESLQKDLEVSKQSVAAALAAQAAAARAGPSEATRLEMQTLQNQVRTLETQLEEDRKNSAREMAAFAAQLQNARETNRSLGEANRSLLQARGSDDSAVKAELEQTTTRLKAAQADAEKARADFSQLQAKHVDTERAASQHGSTVAELTGVNEKLGNEKTALETQLAQSRQAAELARSEIAELKARMTSGDRALREQVASIEELGNANEKLQAQVKELGGQVSTLRLENARLAATGESATAIRAELEDMKTRLADSKRSAEQHGSTVAELTAANDKLAGELKDLQAQLTSLRADNARLAQGDAARQEAEQRAASLGAAATQLTTAQRELATARGEIARLSDTVQALDRDRTTRVAQLQQENAAITARLRQAQGTLDQIASAARFINSGGAAAGAVSNAPLAAANPAQASSAGAPAAGSTAIVPAPRVHVVAEGDTLTRISARYYGTSTRWQEIYDTNREVLRGENALRPGQRLRIP